MCLINFNGCTETASHVAAVPGLLFSRDKDVWEAEDASEAEKKQMTFDAIGGMLTRMLADSSDGCMLLTDVVQRICDKRTEGLQSIGVDNKETGETPSTRSSLRTSYCLIRRIIFCQPTKFLILKPSSASEREVIRLINHTVNGVTLDSSAK